MDEYPAPTDATVKQLYGSAFRCAHPTCSKPLYRVNDETGDYILNSRVAHIHARRRGGPRWIDMDPEANRAAANLIPLCIEHSYEVDDPSLQHIYGADTLQSWKADQLEEHLQAQRAWPLTDEQAAEAAAVSFGQPLDHGAVRIALARAVAKVVTVARRERSGPAQRVAEWEAHWRRANVGAFAYDDNGNRVQFELSRNDTNRHTQLLVHALNAASATLATPLDEARAESLVAAAELPSLSPWLDGLNLSLAAVERAAGRWPAPPPYADDQQLTDALVQLELDLQNLVRRWNGDTTVPPPTAPLPPLEEIESVATRRLREHGELLERARPHARVGHLPADGRLFAEVCDALPFASSLPQVVSFLPYCLDSTARVAAATIKNADDHAWRAAVADCHTIEPLAAAVHLGRALGIMLRDGGHEALADDARQAALDRLSLADWSEPATWIDNLTQVRNLLYVAASALGDDAVRGWISDAVTARPEVAPWAVVGVAQVSESLDSHTLQVAGITYGLSEVPPWLPGQLILDVLDAQGPRPPEDMADPAQRDALPRLVAELRTAVP